MKDPKLNTRFLVIETPIGILRLEAIPGAVTRLYLPGEAVEDSVDTTPLSGADEYPELRSSVVWLENYFNGNKKPWQGSYKIVESEFNRSIYKTLLNVKFGETISYGRLALLAGYPKSARAAGRAMATNPLPILIPCHRVLGGDGSLNGYGGGLPLKKALLELEGVTVK